MATLDNLGPDTLIPKLGPADKMAKLTITPEAGFLLSRIDGRTSIAELIALMPTAAEATAALLVTLADAGAVEVPGRSARTGTGAGTSASTSDDFDLTFDSDLSEPQKTRIDEMLLLVKAGVAHRILGVALDVDPKVARKAFFALSKEFHPDRYYGKNLGSYGDKLKRIFQSLKTAYAQLAP